MGNHRRRLDFMRSLLPLWVTGRRHDYIGIATGAPRIADDILHSTKILCRRSGRKGYYCLVSTFPPVCIGEDSDGSPDSEQPAARRTA
jgi:hypothetical protein